MKPIRSNVHLNRRRAADKRMRDKRRAEGRCTMCGRPPLEGRTRCQKCIDVVNAANVRLKQKRRPHLKALGICVVCFDRKAMEGRTRCGVCAEHEVEYKQTWRTRKKEPAA